MFDDLRVAGDKERMIAARDLDVEVLHPKLLHLSDGCTSARNGYGLVICALDHEKRNVPDGLGIDVVRLEAATGYGG